MALLGELGNKLFNTGSGPGTGSLVDDTGGVGAKSDPIEEAKAKFRESTGRDLRSDELGWINSSYVQSQHGGFLGAVDFLINQRNNYIASIMGDATAIGLTDIDENKAGELYDQLFRAGDPQSLERLSDRISTSLSRLYTEQQKSEAEAEQKPEVSDADQGEARALVEQKFGAGSIEEMGLQILVDEVATQIAGGLRPYQASQFLSNTEEFQKFDTDRQIAKQKTEFDTELQNIESSALQTEEEVFKESLPRIMGELMKRGRLGSSSFGSIISDTRAKLAQRREEFINNLRAEEAFRAQGFRAGQFGVNAGNALNSYLRSTEPNRLRTLGQAQFLGNIPQLQYGSTQGLFNRYAGYADYARQQSDYDRYFQRSLDAQEDAARMGLIGDFLAGGTQGATYGLLRR